MKKPKLSQQTFLEDVQHSNHTASSLCKKYGLTTHQQLELKLKLIGYEYVARGRGKRGEFRSIIPTPKVAVVVTAPEPLAEARQLLNELKAQIAQKTGGTVKWLRILPAAEGYEVVYGVEIEGRISLPVS